MNLRSLQTQLTRTTPATCCSKEYRAVLTHPRIFPYSSPATTTSFGLSLPQVTSTSATPPCPRTMALSTTSPCAAACADKQNRVNQTRSDQTGAHKSLDDEQAKPHHPFHSQDAKKKSQDERVYIETEKNQIDLHENVRTNWCLRQRSVVNTCSCCPLIVLLQAESYQSSIDPEMSDQVEKREHAARNVM